VTIPPAATSKKLPAIRHAAASAGSNSLRAFAVLQPANRSAKNYKY